MFEEYGLLARKVHLLWEPRYVILRVGNLTEEKTLVSVFEFPTDL
jgi:hypothetical protein